MKKKNLIIVAVSCSSIIFAGLFLHNERTGFWSESGVFFSAYLRSPKGVGSIIPSSQFLSKAATLYVKSNVRPIKILEVGAGIGAFTEKIIEKMEGDDLFDVIEIDPELCKILQKKFNDHKNVHIRCLSFLDWNPEFSYDFIVSGLPHNAFGVDFVDAVLNQYKKLIANNGVLSYFEYMSPIYIKKIFLPQDKARELPQVVNSMSNFRKNYQFDSDVVLLNVPPARVYHLRIKKEN